MLQTPFDSTEYLECLRRYRVFQPVGLVSCRRAGWSVAIARVETGNSRRGKGVINLSEWQPQIERPVVLTSILEGSVARIWDKAASNLGVEAGMLPFPFALAPGSDWPLV
jgi:hypothetical protein